MNIETEVSELMRLADEAINRAYDSCGQCDSATIYVGMARCELEDAIYAALKRASEQ